MMQRVWPIFGTLLLLFLPLALGGYQPWAWSLAGVVVATLILVSAWLVWRRGEEIVWRRALAVPMILYIGVLMWILFQWSPLGPDHPIWSLTAAALGGDAVGGSMSIAPQESLAALIRLLTFGGAFWIGLQQGRDRDCAYRFLRWVALATGTYALYGILNFVFGNEYLMWRVREAYTDDVTGTFVNRNSYATFAGLGLIVTLALFILTARRAWRLADPSIPVVVRFLGLLRGDLALFATIAPISAMALLQSHSRMGVLSSAVGVATLLLVGRTLLTVRGRLIAGGVMTVFAIMLFALSGGEVARRIDSTENIDRLPIFALTAKAIETAPLAGHGYGSFAGVLPMFRDMTLPGNKVFLMAHDTYLELAMEIGLPAAVALTVAVAWLALLCLIGAYRRNRDGIIPSIAFAATILVGLHSLLDFSLQIPAIGCLFAALLGIGNAQAWRMQPPARAESDQAA